MGILMAIWVINKDDVQFQRNLSSWFVFIILIKFVSRINIMLVHDASHRKHTKFRINMYEISSPSILIKAFYSSTSYIVFFWNPWKRPMFCSIGWDYGDYYFTPVNEYDDVLPCLARLIVIRVMNIILKWSLRPVLELDWGVGTDGRINQWRDGLVLRWWNARRWLVRFSSIHPSASL